MPNFALSESNRKSPVLLWALHWLASVVVPQIVMAPLADPLYVGAAVASPAHAILFLALLFGVAFGLGTLADLIDPASGRVARMTWIVPTTFLVFAIASEIVTVKWSWIVDEYLLHLPGSPGGGPGIGYMVFTFPALTSVGYSLGSRLHRNRVEASQVKPG
jgi:hypothetical protein